MKTNHIFKAKLTSLALFVSTAASAVTVCPSGCDATTVQNGINLAIASQNTVCKVEYVDIAIGTYSENPVVSGKNCQQYLIIRTQGWNKPYGVRVGPSDSANMAKIVAPTPGFIVSIQASYVHLRGLELAIPAGSGTIYGAAVAWGEEIYSTLYQKNIVEQVYAHSLGTEYRLRRGVFAVCSSCIVRDSYFADNVEVGSDTQGVLAVLAPNLVLENNYLEAAGENFLAGGLGPGGGSRYFLPNRKNYSFIYGNHLPKQMSWKVVRRAGLPYGACYGQEFWIDTSTGNQYRCSGAGGSYQPFVGTILTPTVKNCVELKDGDTVAQGNQCEKAFTQDQAGQAFFINQTGCQLYQTRKFQIEYNYSLQVNIPISYRSYECSTEWGVYFPIENVTFRHNAFQDTSPNGWNANNTNASRWLSFDRSKLLRVENNTVAAASTTDGGYNIFSSPADPAIVGFNNKQFLVSRNIVANGSAVESYFIPPYDSYCAYTASAWFGEPATTANISTNIFFAGGLNFGPCNNSTNGFNLDPTNSVQPTLATVINTTTLVQNAGFEAFGANMADVNSYNANTVSGNGKNYVFDAQLRGAIVTANSITGFAYTAAPSGCSVSGTSGSASILSRTGRNIRWQVTGLATRNNVTVTVNCSGLPTLEKRYRTL